MRIESTDAHQVNASGIEPRAETVFARRAAQPEVGLVAVPAGEALPELELRVASMKKGDRPFTDCRLGGRGLDDVVQQD